MDQTLETVLYIIAAICFGLAAFSWRRTSKSVDLVAAGLLAWVLVPLLNNLL